MISRATLIPVGIVLVFGILVIRESDRGTFDSAEEMFGRWLAANSRRSAPGFPSSKTVLLVEIDDSTRRESWPLTLLDYATFLRAATAFDPEVVAIADPIETPPAGEIESRAFEAAALAVPQLLLARLFERGEPPSDLDGGPSLATHPPIQAVEALGPPRPTSLPESLSAISASGPILLRDPVAALPPVRRAPAEAALLYASPSGIVPSFLLRAIMLAHRIAPGEVLASPGKNIVLGDLFTISVDLRGRTQIPNPFAGGFRRVEFGDFLLAAEQPPDKRPAELSSFRGGVILLGRTDEVSRQNPAGTGRKISNAELFAAGLALLDPMRPMGKRPPAAPWIILAAALLIFLNLRLGDKGAAAVICLLIAAAYPIVAIAFYEHFFVVLPFAPAYALLGFILLCRYLLPARIQRPHKR